MRYDIYFHADKYKRATNTYTSICCLHSMFGCHRKPTSKILINVQRIMNDHHEFLDRLPDFNAKFNLTISHEILHATLKKYISSEASSKLDNLTLKYWEKNIDINMNYEIKWVII